MLAHAFYAASGFISGCFCPSVCAKIKAYLSKEAKVVELDAKAELSKINPKL
jgi:hypothetical protein